MTTWEAVQEKAAAPGSVVLQKWLADRQRIKNASNGATYMVSSDAKIVELLGGAAASSGYAVTETSAMRVSAVYACIARISGAIASLPLPVYERTAEGRNRAANGTIYNLLNLQPNPAWTAASMWEWVIGCNCLRGDAFLQILRNGPNAVGLLPLHPDSVQVENVDGFLNYYIRPTGGVKAYGLHQDDVLHIPQLGFDGKRSPSIIKQAAMQSIGVALAADDFSGKLYANGAMPRHLFSLDGKPDAEQIDLLQRTYADRYTGTQAVGRPMVLPKSIEMKEMSMTAADAQLLDSRKFQVIDIARAFGVPPHMIGATETTSSWGTGIEQQTIGFVKFTLQPYLNRIEQEVNRKLFAFSNGKLFVEFNLDGLLRGDSKAESDVMRQSLGGSQGPGWMTPNEIRKIKNLPPITGGDELYQPKGTINAQPTIATTA